MLCVGFGRFFFFFNSLKINNPSPPAGAGEGELSNSFPNRPRVCSSEALSRRGVYATLRATARARVEHSAPKGAGTRNALRSVPGCLLGRY